jgi:hypothetical protein
MAKYDLRCMQLVDSACKVDQRVTDYLLQQHQKLEPFQQTANQSVMVYQRPIKPYHFQANLIWCDVTSKCLITQCKFMKILLTPLNAPSLSKQNLENSTRLFTSNVADPECLSRPWIIFHLGSRNSDSGSS